ncbi:UNVERIFIED_CONTAM: hypothetical protein GTU68_047812 [Idotea baltica]|nr:hypothetical protein [Idotea baltica]
MSLEFEHALRTGWPGKSDWTKLLGGHFGTKGFQQLIHFVADQRQKETVFPPTEDVFNAFRFTSFDDTKVVILGQDPYHGPGQAHGLSFSVLGDTRIPPSLRNIYKEMVEDLGCEMPTTGDLSSWANQGVLLLNTVLTVRQGEANSHRKKGWEQLTDVVIRLLGQREQKIVFILWGKPAEKKLPLIDRHHETIVSVHPSPLSARRGFFGSRPFSRTNEFLQAVGRKPIQWEIP